MSCRHFLKALCRNSKRTHHGECDQQNTSNTSITTDKITEDTSEESVASEEQGLLNPALEIAIQTHLEKISSQEKFFFQAEVKRLTQHDLFSHVKDIDNAYKDQSGFRPHAEKITIFLQFLERFVASVSIAIQSDPTMSSIIVGGTLIILQSALRFAEYFTKLADMLEQLSEYLGPLAEYTKDPSSLVRNCTVAVYVDLLTFYQGARGVFIDREGNQRTSWRLSSYVFVRSQWEPFEAKFGVIEKRFKHHLDVLRHSVSATLLYTVRDLKASSETYESLARKEENYKKQESLISWLSAPDFERKHLEVSAKRHSDTCHWLLKRPEFTKWEKAPGSSILRCEGKPGIGKSVLASNVVDYISTKYASALTPVVYVYYDYHEEKLKGLSSLILAIIQQICRQVQKIPEWLLEHKRCFRSPSVIGRIESFRRLAQCFDGMFLIFDALDECPSDHRGEVIEFILACVRDLPIKVFVTSRMEPDIVDAFHSTDVSTVKIQATDVADDIRLFVYSQIKKLRQHRNGKLLHLSDDNLEPIIVSSLAEQSDGMFLWVDLQLKNICRISRAKKDHLIMESLTTLPRGLQNTYIRIAHRVENDDNYMRDLAMRCFTWVLNAQQPLCELELQHALTLYGDNIGQDINPISVILDACGNLLVVEDGIVRPIHFTVKEFFITQSLQGPLRSLQDHDSVHERLALDCLHYLENFLSGQSPWHDPVQLEEYLWDCPLLFYCSQFFDHHIEAVNRHSTDILTALERFFKQNSDFFASLLQLRAIQRPNRFTDLISSTRLILPGADASSIFYASKLFRLKHIHDKFAGLKPNIHALHQAAAGGHVELSARLIENGFAINEKDYNHTSALYHACLGGHVGVVLLLLERSADLDTEGGYYGSALQAAASRGQFEIAEMLVNHGAVIDGPEGHFGSALIAAVSEGHLRLVELLLARGADGNLQGRSYGSPLETAAAGGHEEILKLLLRQPNIVVNSTGGRFGTALTAAAANGHENIVHVLSDAGADVNFGGGYYGSALQAASAEGHEKIFRFLLKQGANPYARGGHYETCLQAASVGGHQAIFKLLLDNGADVNVRGGNYGTALQAAIDIQDGYYGTELQAASCGGHDAVASLLLKHGAFVDLLCGEYGTALQAAAYWGHEKIVEMFLDHGADVNIQGGCYGNAIQGACAKGHERIVKLLLQSGADIHIQGGKYGTALYAASFKGHEAVRQMILDYERAMQQK
ncbi:hypothetical protein N7454_001530 [Penicillium verhagenii]|nr:hypothetical protein N7454_001530 [Penicillium verhagenii]